VATTDNRIDAYIARSADFAIPLLEHLREVVHQACPQVNETMKWSFPHFEYKGSILCSMASFKQHCAFGFWLGSQMKDPDGILEKGERSSMGQLGRISARKDIPPKKLLVKYLKEAMALIDKGAKLEKKPAAAAKKELVVPQYFLAQLTKNKKALSSFERFSYSHKKEYVQWIEEAKTDETRNKRIRTAIDWLEEGKSRNWKYERPSR
jgi:uncharacterized protein YdeI (YjbR/CyaY-like superfamily)